MKLRLGFCVLLILALAAVACSSGKSDDAKPTATPAPILTAEEIKQAAPPRAADVKTYGFTVTTTSSTSGTDNGQAVSGAIENRINGVVDEVNKKMRLDLFIKADLPDPLTEGPQEINAQIYITGNQAYLNVVLPDRSSQWQKQDLQADTWETYNQLEQHQFFLSASRIELTGSEKIDGVDAYVLKVTPDVDKLWETLARLAGINELLMDLQPDAAKIIQSMSVELRLAKNTLLPVKMDGQVTLVMNSQTMMLPEGQDIDMTIDTKSSVQYRDFGEAMVIELPEEASTAREGNFL